MNPDTSVICLCESRRNESIVVYTGDQSVEDFYRRIEYRLPNGYGRSEDNPMVLVGPNEEKVTILSISRNKKDLPDRFSTRPSLLLSSGKRLYLPLCPDVFASYLSRNLLDGEDEHSRIVVENMFDSTHHLRSALCVRREDGSTLYVDLLDESYARYLESEDTAVKELESARGKVHYYDSHPDEVPKWLYDSQSPEDREKLYSEVRNQLVLDACLVTSAVLSSALVLGTVGTVAAICRVYNEGELSAPLSRACLIQLGISPDALLQNCVMNTQRLLEVDANKSGKEKLKEGLERLKIRVSGLLNSRCALFLPTFIARLKALDERKCVLLPEGEDVFTAYYASEPLLLPGDAPDGSDLFQKESSIRQTSALLHQIQKHIESNEDKALCPIHSSVYCFDPETERFTENRSLVGDLALRSIDPFAVNLSPAVPVRKERKFKR